MTVTIRKGDSPVPFGHVLRARRLEMKLSLRKFADLVGVSPTYLSQVEQCNVAPPPADRIRRMAELLASDPNEWILVAGRIPPDLHSLLCRAPAEIARLLHAIRGMNSDRPTSPRVLGPSVCPWRVDGRSVPGRHRARLPRAVVASARFWRQSTCSPPLAIWVQPCYGIILYMDSGTNAVA